MKKLLPILIAVIVFACTKEIEAPVEEFQSKISGKKFIEVDDFTPPMGFNLFKRKLTPELKRASENAGKAFGKGKGRGKPPKGDTTTPPPPPPPPEDTSTYDGDYVIFYDFDGQDWFSHYMWHSGIKLEPSGLTAEAIAQCLAAAQKAYEPYNILVTADSTEYFKRPVGARQWMYVTTTWEVFGKVGGAAYNGSMFSTSESPGFIFSGLLSYSGKWVGDAMVHEAGHTLTLTHQGDWKNGIFTSSYSQGFTPLRSPEMGIPYYDADGGEFLRETWLQITDGLIWYIRKRDFTDQIDHDILIAKVGARK